ncbi:MAG: DUF3786 domain-containing protein [Nitrospirota bacterium]|nr:DUF3786 domain-containing protein [Nitrospirota bacterium]
MLPKKNCGECRQGKCMPFALALIKGDAELSECPYLNEDAVDELKEKIVHSDWREDLILRLREDVRRIDFREVATQIGADLQNGTLLLKCMGREFAMDSGGEITTKGPVTPWIKILILHYVKTGGSAELGGKWVSFSELKSGMVKSFSFTRECEEPLREMLDGNTQKAALMLECFGAEKQEGFPTSHAWRIVLLPKMPVVILFWPADSEFASKVKILFDSTADRFLDIESIMFLVEGLVYNLEAAMARPVKGTSTA